MSLLERIWNNMPVFTCEKQVDHAVQSVIDNAQSLRYAIINQALKVRITQSKRRDFLTYRGD